MKKIKSFPWTKQEEAWLRQAIKDHPEWSNATMYNQMKYAIPYTEHTKKATASKINTLRPSRGKCKWNATKHTTLAQQFTYGMDHESMADYFDVSVPAIVHQLHKLEKLGMIKRTPGRQVVAHTRVVNKELPLLKTIDTKQLNFDFNQEVRKQNERASKIFAIDASVEKLMQDKARTATETKLGYNNQDAVLNNMLQSVHDITQLLGNMLQVIRGN